ncbi:hypothetical protein CN918_32010 [Priestia megaterium]|nr:hypothetical protein CN918_32010 [Priestia megaterium]
MYQDLIGKEKYIINAIYDRCANISDVTFTGETEDHLMSFQANNDLYDIPCSLKTDGRVLWIEIDKEDWRPLIELDIDAHIPKTEPAVFMDHFEAVELIRSYRFSRDELEDFLAVVLSQQKLTKSQTIEQLDDIKAFFKEHSTTKQP